MNKFRSYLTSDDPHTHDIAHILLLGAVVTAWLFLVWGLEELMALSAGRGILGNILAVLFGLIVFVLLVVGMVFCVLRLWVDFLRPLARWIKGKRNGNNSLSS